MRVSNATAAVLFAVTGCIAVIPTSSSVAGRYEDAMAAQRRGDHAAALRVLRPLGDGGDADAQAALGIMYANGHGVQLDRVEALLLLRSTAATGSETARTELARVETQWALEAPRAPTSGRTGAPSSAPSPAQQTAAEPRTYQPPSHRSAQPPNAAPQPWQHCRERGQVLAEIAKQRDRGLPLDAAIMIMRRVLEGTPGAENGVAQRLTEPLYAPPLSGQRPVIISSSVYMHCVQQGTQSHASPFQPTSAAARERQDQLLEMMRAGTDEPALGRDHLERQRNIERRLEAVTPRRADESEEDWRREIAAIAEASLAPARARAAEIQRQEAERRERQERQAEAQQQQAEAQRQRAERERREAEARAEARAQYLRDHPEEAERERLLAEQQRRQAELEAQWYVMYRGGTCEPISSLAPGARTPQEALSYLRVIHPVAFISGEGTPFPTIQLPDSIVPLASGFKNCVALRQNRR